ncbi:MAG: DNA-binding XRE family transcriptional regulator [Rickettsiales bacterium]|jgi:DNA-binding XRE family transcriptional regulator
MKINAKQCKAARNLLEWSQKILAEKSQVSKAAISFFERGETCPTARTQRDFIQAFEDAGIRFIDNKTECGAVVLKEKY